MNYIKISHKENVLHYRRGANIEALENIEKKVTDILENCELVEVWQDFKPLQNYYGLSITYFEPSDKENFQLVVNLDVEQISIINTISKLL